MRNIPNLNLETLYIGKKYVEPLFKNWMNGPKNNTDVVYTLLSKFVKNSDSVIDISNIENDIKTVLNAVKSFPLLPDDENVFRKHYENYNVYENLKLEVKKTKFTLKSMLFAACLVYNINLVIIDDNIVDKPKYSLVNHNYHHNADDTMFLKLDDKMIYLMKPDLKSNISTSNIPTESEESPPINFDVTRKWFKNPFRGKKNALIAPNTPNLHDPHPRNTTQKKKPIFNYFTNNRLDDLIDARKHLYEGGGYSQNKTRRVKPKTL